MTSIFTTAPYQHRTTSVTGTRVSDFSFKITIVADVGGQEIIKLVLIREHKVKYRRDLNSDKHKKIIIIKDKK